MTSPAPHFDLDAPHAYRAWRDRKLADRPRSIDELVVAVRDPLRLSAPEREALLAHCARANMVVVAAPPLQLVQGELSRQIARALGAQLGLATLDTNYLADDDGFSPITVSAGAARGEFIPYTNRPIRWHTDGYYNPPERTIRAMVLHCVQRAETGGENRVLDHELVYLQLRERDPDLVRALLAPDAMTIPARHEDGHEARADQSGPVFAVAADGSLHMRYTARTRSIVWKDDAATRAAVAALESLLEDNPFTLRLRLEPGMALVCNNVLHDRAAFSDSPERKRLLLRARYYERVGHPARGAARPALQERTA